MALRAFFTILFVALVGPLLLAIPLSFLPVVGWLLIMPVFISAYPFFFTSLPLSLMIALTAVQWGLIGWVFAHVAEGWNNTRIWQWAIRVVIGIWLACFALVVALDLPPQHIHT